MRKFMCLIALASGLVLTLYGRFKVYEWFYNDVIRIIPQYIWKPLDFTFAIIWYGMLAYSIFQIIKEKFI